MSDEWTTRPYLSDEERATVAEVLREHADRIHDLIQYDDDDAGSQVREASDLESIADRIEKVPGDARLGAVLKRYEVHRLLKAVDLAQPLMGRGDGADLSEIRAKLQALAQLRASFDRARRNDDSDNWHDDDRLES